MAKQQIKRRRTKTNFNEKLNPGEKLLIWRRRLDWNQAQAAEYYNCSLFQYKLAEYNSAKNFKYKNITLGSLSPWEICLLYRKRAGKTQLQTGKELGVGRYWIRLQEMGEVPCTRLLEFWEGTG